MPEIRPPSIKGMMRFWWRAINGDLEVGELKRREGVVFGGTDKKEGQSTFSIIARSSVIKTSKYQPLPHHTGTKGFRKTGFSPGEQFEVILLTRNNKSVDSKKIETPDWISDLFEISCLLGGFGNRSRRGFGSVALHGLEPGFQLICNKLNNIYGDDIFILDKTNYLIKSPFSSPTAHPSIKTVELGQKSYTTHQELLKTIGNASHKYNPSGSNALGKVRGGRLASPVYVSVLKIDGEYRPIVTTLNVIPDENDSQNKFREAICT
ncbi:MAG TPA: type III-B CRISPR module RAMP protein Cmr1 [Firmicutes bacterium]|nr:type III-B CRISPR module RAMP protein Cmr1 [Bacillota bacterium]